MRILLWSLLLSLAAFVAAQEKDKWQRIYTYEDSVIELNVSKVTFVNNNIGRVTFRTIWSKPQNLKGTPPVKYKTRLETMEFKCEEKQYRLYQVTLLDSKGKTVQSHDMESTEEWKVPKGGIVMDKLFGAACQLIAEKRRNP
jgi:hypothetical protein